MVNMKYYLILLISVFLSLGIGISIGISLESKDVLEKQHSILVQRLEQEFAVMRSENQQLKEALASLEETERENKKTYESIFNSIVKNKLDGLKVSLIEVGDQGDFSSIISLLKISGASIETSITFESKLFEENPSLDDAIIASSQIGADKSQLYSQLAEDIMYSLLTGASTPLIKDLNRLNLLHSSMSVQNSYDVIILACNDTSSNKKNVEQFNNSFIGLCKEYDIPIIVVENQENNLIDIDQYKKMGISTVDHVNTLYGKLSLISLLYGNTGNYGYKEGCQGILPDELFPADIYFEKNDEVIEVE